MLLDADDCQMLLIDYQTRLMPAMFEGDRVLANAVTLARLAQLFQVPLWGTAQNPDKLGPHAPELLSVFEQANGHMLDKMHFSAAADGLVGALRPAPAKKPQQGGNARSLPRHLQKVAPPDDETRSTIVLAGCEAHVCMMQTALDLLEAEFDVWVVTDACGARTERNRDAAFDRLAGNGAELVTTEMVAFEWLRTAEHPVFKQVQALIK
jgi:nicotinamidase-related amidase